MQNPTASRFIVCASLIISMLLSGCGGGVDDDLDKSPEEVQKTASSLSAEELQKRIDEITKRSDALRKQAGDKEPTDDQMKQMGKYVQLVAVYSMELAKKQTK